MSERPSPGTNHPASAIHSPALSRDIQPCVNSCGTNHGFCHQPSKFSHSLYDLVGEYMEFLFLHDLNPPSLIPPFPVGGKMKNVTILLTWLHYLLSIMDRVKKLLVRKLIEWLWWKFAFT